MDDRNEWLQSLKKGDEVTMLRGGYGVRIDRVERTTSTLIILQCGARFRRGDGWEVGGDAFAWQVSPCTDAHRLVIMRQETSHKMKNAATGRWSRAKCHAVRDAMNLPDDYTGEASTDES